MHSLREVDSLMRGVLKCCVRNFLVFLIADRDLDFTIYESNAQMDNTTIAVYYICYSGVLLRYSPIIHTTKERILLLEHACYRLQYCFHSFLFEAEFGTPRMDASQLKFFLQIACMLQATKYVYIIKIIHSTCIFRSILSTYSLYLLTSDSNTTTAFVKTSSSLELLRPVSRRRHATPISFVHRTCEDFLLVDFHIDIPCGCGPCFCMMSLLKVALGRALRSLYSVEKDASAACSIGPLLT